MPLNKAVTSPPLKLRHTVYSPICIKGCSLRTRTRQLFPAKGVCNWSLCFLPADKAGGSPRNTRHLQPPSALPGGRHRRDHRPLQAGPAPARAPPPHPSRLPSAAFPVRPSQCGGNAPRAQRHQQPPGGALGTAATAPSRPLGGRLSGTPSAFCLPKTPLARPSPGSSFPVFLVPVALRL